MSYYLFLVFCLDLLCCSHEKTNTSIHRPMPLLFFRNLGLSNTVCFLCNKNLFSRGVRYQCLHVKVFVFKWAGNSVRRRDRVCEASPWSRHIRLIYLNPVPPRQILPSSYLHIIWLSQRPRCYVTLFRPKSCAKTSWWTPSSRRPWKYLDSKLDTGLSWSIVVVKWFLSSKSGALRVILL